MTMQDRLLVQQNIAKISGIFYNILKHSAVQKNSQHEWYLQQHPQTQCGTEHAYM
jgi:hypothetical protein